MNTYLWLCKKWLAFFSSYIGVSSIPLEAPFIFSLIAGLFLLIGGLLDLFGGKNIEEKKNGARLVWLAFIQLIFFAVWPLFIIPLFILAVFSYLLYYTTPNFWNKIYYLFKNLPVYYHAFQLWLLVKLKLAKYPSTKDREEGYYRNKTEL